jgi:hypothetical protein
MFNLWLYQNKLVHFENTLYVHVMYDSTTYFARAVGYACKIFMILTIDVEC